MDFQPSPEPDRDAEGGSLDADYCRGVLHELIEIGAALARLVLEQATAQAVPVGEAVAAYERVSRAMRRSVLLAQRLDAPGRAPAPGRAALRRQIIRSVEDAIQRETDDEAAEALHAEFLERLDGPDVLEDVGDRPVEAIIADICRDLGLGAMPGRHAWKRRMPADVAVLCARAASVGGIGGGALAAGAAARLGGEAGCRGP